MNLSKGRAIISLIGNVQHSSLILERVRSYLLPRLLQVYHKERCICSPASQLFVFFFNFGTGVSCSLDQRYQCPDDITRSIQGKKTQDCLSQNSLLVPHLTNLFSCYKFLQVNISLIVNDDEAEGCVEALHKSFFESGDLSELLIQPRFGNGSPVRALRVEN